MGNPTPNALPLTPLVYAEAYDPVPRAVHKVLGTLIIINALLVVPDGMSVMRIYSRRLVIFPITPETINIAVTLGALAIRFCGLFMAIPYLAGANRLRPRLRTWSWVMIIYSVADHVYRIMLTHWLADQTSLYSVLFRALLIDALLPILILILVKPMNSDA